LRDQNVPSRIQEAVQDPAAHSDDEKVEKFYLPNLPIDQIEDLFFPLTDDEVSRLPEGTQWSDQIAYVVRSKPLRSEKYTNFFKHIDKSIRLEKKFTRKRTPTNLITFPRVRKKNPEEALLPLLPSKAPMDYFIPEEFNALSPGLRRKFGTTKVAFPLDEQFIYQHPVHESMTMPIKQFVKKYAKEVLKKYDIPVLDPEEEEDDVESVDYDDDDEDEEYQQQQG
jgi:hypothetical protein